MSAVLYFSKLNLVSGHIFEVYKDESMLNKILDTLKGDLHSGIEYKSEKIYTDATGEKCFSNTTYKLSIQNKDDVSVCGVIYKNSIVYYKSFDAEKNELVRHSVPNTEGVRFYFDIYKETIGFHTSHRMGYKDFNEAFTGIINVCMEEKKREFRFEVSLRTEGLEISEITEQLKKIKSIKELKFKFQPPNPDTEDLERIKENGESLICGMDDANVTGMSVLFTSKSVNGVNLDSDIIKENIDRIQGISTLLGNNRKAISKGYTSVEAIGKNGKKYTTAESKPIKAVVSNIENFVDECKKVIAAIL